jgi:asparagine synthase (glutamine-hydrolysing)
MCGIAGFWSSRLNEKDLTAGLDKLQHRGPDETSFIQFSESKIGSVAIGMTRLAIVDVVSGHQPYLNESKSVSVVFNGEIYNHKSLRAELISKGHTFASEADGEVIAHLYEEYGRDFPRVLNGMFAIGLFDKSQDTLLLCRDRFGEKPLYYSQVDGETVFASEISALRSIVPRTETKINRQAAANLLTYGFVGAPLSIFQGIKKVPAGSTVEITKRGTATLQYWIPAHEVLAKLSEKSPGIKDLDVALRNAVEIRIPAEVNYGVLLSGGIDSALVAKYASQLSIKRIPSFTVSFPGTRFDESSAAKQTAKILGLDYNVVAFPDDPEELWDEYIGTFDEPNLDSSSLPTLLVSKFASSSVKVLLSGDGGDELFGGYPKYQQAIAMQSFRIIPKFISDSFAKNASSSTVQRLWQLVGAAKSSQVALSDALNEQYFYSWERLIDRPSIERTNLDRGMIANRSSWLDLDLSGYLPGILQKVDMASMAHSLEVRSPLLDINLYNFARGVPPSKLFDFFQTKKLLRKLATTSLPKSITEAPKSGFSPHRNKIVDWRLGRGVPNFGLGNSPLEQAFGFSLPTDYFLELLSYRPKSDRKIWSLLVLNDWVERWL